MLRKDGWKEGQTDGSVTISLRNFIGEGIIKLKNTNLCIFCKIHLENIEHLFFDCPVTQRFLKSLSKQLKQYYKKEYFIALESVYLLVNLIFIIAKNYIFKCKLNELRLNIVEFKHKIMWYHSLDQYISKKNNTILAYEQMWTPYNIFSSKHNIFFLFVNILMRFIFHFCLLSVKCQKQLNIFEKQNCKRVWVNDLMKVFIIYFFLFCLSKCKIHVVAKFIVLKMPVST